MAVQPIPKNFHTLTPYLLVEGIDKLVEFLKKAFDAKVIDLMEMPDGTVMHAQLKIGDSMIMMGEPRSFKPMTGMLYLYVEDVDTVYKQAINAGATSLREPVDEFYGDRAAGVEDMLGNQWWIATHKEDVSQEELKKRAQSLM